MASASVTAGMRRRTLKPFMLEYPDINIKSTDDNGQTLVVDDRLNAGPVIDDQRLAIIISAFDVNIRIFQHKWLQRQSRRG
jgi:hypothetical protein